MHFKNYLSLCNISYFGFISILSTIFYYSDFYYSSSLANKMIDFVELSGRRGSYIIELYKITSFTETAILLKLFYHYIYDGLFNLCKVNMSYLSSYFQLGLKCWFISSVFLRKLSDYLEIFLFWNKVYR